MRTLDAGTLAALAASGEGVSCVALHLDGGTVRLTTSAQTVTFASVAWTPAGPLSVAPVQESDDSRAGRVGLTLDAVDIALVSPLLSEPLAGRAVDLYRVWLEDGVATGGVLLASGRLDDGMEIIEEPDADPPTARIEATLSPRQSSLDFARSTLANDTSQQARWPGDRAFEFVGELATREIVWKPR
ncbi:MAG: hypothetical protein RQ723_12645 [Desulfuromonadales bacterium]|nr:hypothetical protein [Desulfuromonadales bacterium]